MRVYARAGPGEWRGGCTGGARGRHRGEAGLRSQGRGPSRGEAGVKGRHDARPAVAVGQKKRSSLLIASFISVRFKAKTS